MHGSPAESGNRKRSKPSMAVGLATTDAPRQRQTDRTNNKFKQYQLLGNAACMRPCTRVLK
jgi:hypothetical protein